MGRRRAKRVRAAALLDNVGSLGRTPEEELRDEVRTLEEVLDVRIEAQLCSAVSQFPEGTDLVLFDYGGVCMGYGENLLARQEQALVRWADDHPSALVLVVSSFTWDRVGGYDLRLEAAAKDEQEGPWASGALQVRRLIREAYEAEHGREKHLAGIPNVIPLHATGGDDAYDRAIERLKRHCREVAR